MITVQTTNTFQTCIAPIGYEAYGEYDVFPNAQEALLPVEGTISRGHSLYEFENTNEGYAAALSDLKSPIASTSWTLKEEKSCMIFIVESVTEQRSWTRKASKERKNSWGSKLRR